MDLIQKIKEQGNQASALLPGVADMAASNEVITIDITGCTSQDDDSGSFLLTEGDGPIKKAQIADWVKSKAKFLRLTFKYNSMYGSVLFAKDAITQTNSLDYTKTQSLWVESFISKINNTKFIFDLNIWPSGKSASFYVHKVNFTQV